MTTPTRRHPADDDRPGDVRDLTRREHCPTCHAITPQYVYTHFVSLDLDVKVALSFICLLCGEIIEVDSDLANQWREYAAG